MHWITSAWELLNPPDKDGFLLRHQSLAMFVRLTTCRDSFDSVSQRWSGRSGGYGSFADRDIQYPTKIPAPIVILQLKTWFLALCCNTNLIGINLERKYLIQYSFLVTDLKPELELCTISIFISSQSWLLLVHRPLPYIMQPLPCIWPYKIKCLDFDQIYLAIASQCFDELLQGLKFDVKVESTAYL